MDHRPTSSNQTETKLAAARTRLILDKPFLGALVLRLPMVAADPKWCPTTATDARRFYFNAEYIASLSMDETQFMLAHEALHCALSHFARRQHRAKSRWDRACDYAINPLLLEEGLSPPANSLVNDAFKGMTAEEIYPCLDDASEEKPLDQHAYDPDMEEQQQDSGERETDRSGTGQQPQDQESPDDRGQGSGHERNERPAQSPRPSGSDGSATPEQTPDAGQKPRLEERPEPLTPEEQETLNVQWQQRLAGAAQQALQAGKLRGSLARMIEHLLQPQLPWRMLLARYMTSASRDDFSYSRPSRREGDFILPKLRSDQINVVIAIDTSGSIRREEIDEFLSEVNAIKGQMRARVSLLACDAELASDCPWIYEPWEAFRLPDSLQGGGGTAFEPVFRWVGNETFAPDLLVYFTDADGTFPEKEPPYPVIWLVKGRKSVPWGQRIQLN